MAGGAGDDDDIITAINVTPLVDIVLVLLIILMVTANYLASQSIPMELPRAATGESTEESVRLVVNIQPDGQLFLGTEPVDRAGLRRAVRAFAESNENPQAVIAADGAVSHREVVQVIDLLRSERVTRFAINVNPEDLETSE